MLNVYSFKTEKGAQIDLAINVEKINKKTVYADGHKIEVPCKEWLYTVDECRVNGKAYPGAHLEEYAGFKCVCYGYKGSRGLYIKLPDAVANEIYGEEKAYRKEKLQKELAVYAAYTEHRNTVLRAMRE